MLPGFSLNYFPVMPKTTLHLILSIIVGSSFALKPLIITSDRMLDHKSAGYHPECPQRLLETFGRMEDLKNAGNIRMAEPSIVSSEMEREKVLGVIRQVHNHDYVEEVEMLVNRGARLLSPWDADTYISRGSFDTLLAAQSSWLDAVDEVLDRKCMAFALARPPGHHAEQGGSMGFCIFNFAIGAARYAIEKYKISRISILDFDVHYGNGVADLMKSDPNIRYASLHQSGIFPRGRGDVDEAGDHGNILNIPLESGCTWVQYQPLLVNQAIPFLQANDPELVIVCAGYDAMYSDETAELNLNPNDYGEMAQILKQSFGSEILFGLEGGYNLEDLPIAVQNTVLPFTE